VTRLLVAIALALVMLLALSLRISNRDEVFTGSEGALIRAGDASYHARRALYSFVNFPAVLTFDSYVAWPDGATVPMPPLYDWTLAAVARLFGDTEAVFEQVVACWSPLIAALTVIPVYAIGRMVAGPSVGLGAALVYGVLPPGLARSLLGDIDHHATVALLGSAWLVTSLALLRPRIGAAALARLAAAMAPLRAALLLSWSGALVYVLIGEGALLLAAATDGRRALTWAQAAGALGAAALLTPWLVASGAGISATNLSWLHALLLLATAAVAAGAPAFARSWTEGSVLRRLAATIGLALLVGSLLLLAAPGALDAIAPAFDFLSKQDSWAARNVEQSWLFARPPTSGSAPLWHAYGYLAWVIPLTPLAPLLLWRDREQRPRAVCLACWLAALGVLTVWQARFGSDFAPVVSVAFALILGALASATARILPRVPVSAVALALGIVLLWPALPFGPLRRLAASDPQAPPERLIAPEASQIRFMQLVREATPKTSGFFDVEEQPEYAVLCKPSMGHTLVYHSRRPSVATGFGPYLDRFKYLHALRFYQVASKQTALELLEATGARYVVTYARDATGSRRFTDRLHLGDGLFGEEAPSQRLRLVVEGPMKGTPDPLHFPAGVPERVMPYKLFELVRGAEIVGLAPPGTEMRVAAQIATNTGRLLPFRALVLADAGGFARLRVPYPTEPSAPTRTRGAYRVALGDAHHRVHVTESEVREGRKIELVSPTGEEREAPNG
jgi:dolichyl-diphosphooligosaccharide--protein glycosyltransferase